MSVTAYTCDAKEAGGCNGCNRYAHRVWVVSMGPWTPDRFGDMRSNGTVQVRLCRSCMKELRDQTRGNK